jgi:Uncharacterised protein family UPF0547
MKKTCPRCHRQVSVRARRCRHCRYPFPEGRGPKPAGLAVAVGFPLFLMGTAVLFAGDAPALSAAIATAAIVVGVILFFDTR